MRLEDALLFVVLDADELPGCEFYDITSSLIDVGADIVGVSFSSGVADIDILKEVGKACKDDDAIFIVWQDAGLVEKCSADGVHLSDAQDSIGQARAAAGDGKIVGFTTRTLEEATLAGELSADYIVHMAGVGCPAVFGQMRGGASSLYAGGFSSADEARGVVGNGVFRICVEINKKADATAEYVAGYSRLFGRII